MLLTIGGLAMVFACLALIGLVGTAAQDVAQRAVTAADTDESQKVTAVCVGLNIGSCRTTQESTSTRPADDGGGNPWPVSLFVTAVLCPMILLAMIVWFRSEEW